MGRKRATTLLGALLAATVASPAYPTGNPDAARPIISENCVSCHDVPGFEAKYGKAEVNAPDFQTIADQPETYSADQIRQFLQHPHYPMAKFVLSSSDIENIIAFIQSLRHQ